MILKGKKVILRPVRMSDAPRFVKWFNDPEVNKFMFLRAIDLKAEKKWIRENLKDKNKLNLAIETKRGEHIGTTGLEINRPNNRAYFGIIIGEKKYWSQGLGYEAAGLIINYGFEKLRLHRIELDVYDYNPRAQGLYRKLGFKKEGVKREHNLYKGKYRQAFYMGLLDREWKKRKN